MPLLLQATVLLLSLAGHAHLEPHPHHTPGLTKLHQQTRDRLVQLSHRPTRRQTTTPSQVPGPPAPGYVYDEVTLPVVFPSRPSSDDTGVVSTDTAPPADDLTEDIPLPDDPEPVCMIDPADVTQTFNLIDVGQHILTPDKGASGRVGRLTDDDFAGYTEAQVENYEPPAFWFSHPDSAPSGYYDIVTSTPSGTRYIGRTSSGNVQLSSTSSEGHSPVGPDGIVTTLFRINCQGFITASASGGSFVWDTASTYATLLLGAQTRDNSIFTVPTRPPPGVTIDGQQGEDRRMARRLLDEQVDVTLARRRLSSYSRGSAPRCRNWPPRLYSDVRPGARNESVNGCGSGATSQWIPQFSFGGCCNDHDRCFDNCVDGEFEPCNNVFTGCMVDGVCGRIPWYHPLDKIACKVAGRFYGWVVSTWLGENAFNDANRERCECRCPDSGTGFCNGNCIDITGDSNNCGACGRRCGAGTHCENRQCVCDAYIWGNDDNNCGACGRRCANNYGCRSGQCVCTADIINDSNNCGGCGNVCPRGTRCGGGQCVCAKNQCGNLCLDFQTHPRNCGSCGKVCPSGVCYLGQCIDPPDDPNTCTKRDAVKNGGFDNSTFAGYAWEPNQQTGVSRVNFGYDAGATSPPNAAIITFGNSYVSLMQKITMCPNNEYALTFNIRKDGGAQNGYCWVATVIAGRNTGATILRRDHPVTSIGPFWFNVPVKPFWSRPWDSITYSDNGVFAYAKIDIGLSCSESGGVESTFVIDDVSVYPS